MHLPSSSSAPRGRQALAVILCLAASAFGCFKDPKVDTAQPRRCETSKNCPYGFACGPDGLCCSSADGQTCSAPVATGGAGGKLDGSSGRDGSLGDLDSAGTGGGWEVGTGLGGAGGSGGSIDVGGVGGQGGRDGGPDAPLGGGAGSGTGGGGLGGATGTGGILGSGGVTGPGGTSGAGGLIPAGGSGSGGMGTGGSGTGGSGTGGGGGQTAVCGPSQKVCNGTCIANAECCGGCSGSTPVCSAGTCVGKALGDDCSIGTECTSGACADGVCCNEACAGVCEACNLAAHKGTCYPSTAPRTPCTASGTVCDGTCDGTEAHRKACSYPPSSTQCAAGTCESGTQTYPKMCDGAGHCAAPSPATRTCSPYACADATSCATGCPSGQDTCGGSTCVALNTAAHCGTCSNVCTAPRSICSGGTTCVQCTGNSNCSGTTPACNTSTGTCVGCVGDADCAARTDGKRVCSNNTCVQCKGNADCSGATPTCNTSNNTCVGCVGNPDCPSTKPICSGTTCVQCIGDGNCSSPTPRCSNSTCVQCSDSTHCTATYGAGSTCNTSSHTCQCRQPTKPANLLENPGFETSLTGWASANYCGTACPSPLENWDSTADADNCPASGSVRMNYYGFAFGMLAQCVAAGAGAYRFGYRFKQASLDYTDAVLCTVYAFPGTSCTGDYLTFQYYYSGGASAGWASPSLGTTFVAPSGTGRIQVICQSTTASDVWVDQVYLNASGAYY